MTRINHSNKAIGFHFAHPSKNLQFADMIAENSNPLEETDEKDHKNKCVMPNHNKSIIQRTITSVDRHINVHRELWNTKKN